MTKADKPTMDIEQEIQSCEWSFMLIVGALDCAADIAPHDSYALQTL